MFTENWCLCSKLSAANQTQMVEKPSEDYQDFINEFPVTRYRRDLLHYQKFGACPAQALPRLLALSDWFLSGCLLTEQNACPRLIGSVPDHYESPHPHVVFAHASRMSQLAHLSETYLTKGNRTGRVLVIAGSDQRLSLHTKKIRFFQTYFGTILYEAKDILFPGVRSMPMGLTEHYLRRGVADAAASAIRTACIENIPNCKRRRVLATTLSTHWIEYAVPRDRDWARNWAGTGAARHAGVVVRTISPRFWWHELAKFQFLLSPMGNAIQSVKTIEALLVLTVPIVTPGPVHEDLVRLGFPIVIVNRWSNITRSALDSWWKQLAPRLRSFRKNCLSTEGYWRVITGGGEPCG